MPAFSPIKRRDLILNLRKAGFDGPYSGVIINTWLRDI